MNWMWSLRLRKPGQARDLRMGATNWRSPLSFDTLRMFKDDTGELSRLSNLAHFGESSIPRSCIGQVLIELSGTAERTASAICRALKLASTLEADLIRPPLDREHSAQLPVMTAEDELKNPARWIHRSCSRRRSQLPWASSHARSSRMLPRASAIAQSAAP